jgi:hypothetical protein
MEMQNILVVVVVVTCCYWPIGQLLAALNATTSY